MSEKEIIEKIEKIIKHFESQEYILNGQKIYEYIQGLLDLYNKQKEEIEELKKELYQEDKEEFETPTERTEEMVNMKWVNHKYISKDKVLDILGYEEEDEQRNNMTTEKLLSLLETIISENNRLEDTEDRKVQVEIQNIENRRDKYWKDKIREKIKDLEDLMTLFTNDREKFNRHKYARNILEKLLGE